MTRVAALPLIQASAAIHSSALQETAISALHSNFLLVMLPDTSDVLHQAARAEAARAADAAGQRHRAVVDRLLGDKAALAAASAAAAAEAAQRLTASASC